MARTDFTDEERAEIYRLDHATCTYSGRSLWIADYGLDPIYQIDWADHVIPASSGGPSTVDNGAVAAHLYNYLRGRDRQRLPLFHRGLPTEEHTTSVGLLDPVIVDQLRRFASLHRSDWFINRAMWHVWIACAYEYQRRHGAKRSRDFNYYARCSFTALQKWRRLSDSTRSDLERRGLLPKDAEPDQIVLLSVRGARSTADVMEIMTGAYPFYEAAAEVTHALVEANSDDDLKVVVGQAESTKHLAPRLRERAVIYVHALQMLLRTRNVC